MSNLVKRMDLRGAKATLAALPWVPRAILPHSEPRALSSARPTPLLRASRFALLALALCGMLLLMATPAIAQQTVITLVSNTGQTIFNNQNLSSSFPAFSQAFTSGTNASGYTLDSIGINFDTIADTSTAAAEVTVTLNADNSGDAGDVLCTLTDPATFSSSGVHTFDAPSSGTRCPTLAASTTYFGVVTLVNSAGTSVVVETTNVSSEDSGGAAGWSLADAAAFYQQATSLWHASANAMLMEVKGFNAVATPGVTISETDLTVAEEGTTTDTYTVVLDTAPSAGTVTITVTETGDDITVAPASLAFTTTTWSMAQTVTVTAVDDSIDDDNETVTITHAVSMSGDTTNYPTTLSLGSVDVAITDNDDPPGVILVKNTGQTAFATSTGGHLTSTGISFAQGFTTGASAAGYTLSSIGINFRTIADTSTAGSELTASLRDANEGGVVLPTTVLCTLDDPASFASSGLHTFSAPTTDPCPTLAASTTYFFVIERANDNTSAIAVAYTNSDDEDSGGAAGWSLSNVARHQMMAGGTWAQLSGKRMIEVRGETVPVPPGVTISETTLEVTEGGATDTYTVVLDTAPTGDVTIAVTETSADISLSATTLTFGTANWSAAQTVTVTAVDDSIDEDEETVTITHSVSTTADSTDYPTSLMVDSVDVTVTDNDATAPGAPVLTAAAKNESIELTWTIADHGTSNITRFDYRIKQTTGGTYPATWTDTSAAASNTGGSATIGSLTNGTQYTVQVRGVSSDGEGAGSNEPTATPDAPPSIDSVAITSTPATANTYIIGEDIVVTVTFDKNIAFSGSGSDPYLALRVGTGDTKEVNCDSGTPPTKDLVCTYTVVENDEDGDGVSVPSGTITRSTYLIVGPLGQTAVLTHTGLAASANHKVDGVKPTLSSANASGDLTKVVLTFSEAIGTVDNTKITVKKGGTDQTTTGAAIDSANSTKVEITLTTALLSTDTNITVELAADAVTDVPGNGIAAVSATTVSLVDNTAPAFVSAGTNDTDEVVLTYSEALNTTQPATSAFTVKVGGNNRGVDTVAISGSAVTLTLASAFRPGDTLTVAYSKPGTNPIKDAADNEAASLPETTVTNNLPATAPEAVASLTASNTSTFGEVDLQWSGGTWANGSAITRHEVRYGAPIWSATLTVKDLGSNFLGCDTSTNQGCEPGELLTDNAFSYDSVDYLIDTIDLIGGQLRLITNRSTITAASLADLTLDVGGLSFPFADATHSAGALTWTGAGLSWSEDDMVPLAISTISSLPWTSISDSAPGEANETSHTLEGLDPGEEYTFEVRAVNDVGGGGEASDTLTLLAPAWSFTLRDGGGDVTGLTEGGDPATATVTITNAGQATFGADQTITLEWGGRTLVGGRIQGAGNTSTITILAGASSGSLVISAHNNDPIPIYIPFTADLTAKWEDAVIGTIQQLRRIEDESPPVARITDAPESVNEGDTIGIDIELSVRYPAPGALRFTIADGDSALSGTLPDRVVLAGSELTATVTLTAVENTTQNDGARTVTFTLETSTDIPYTLGTPKTVTIIVRDDDTPPLAVGDLRAQAGNTEATLRWNAPPAPTPDHGQPILRYEYRVKEGTGSFGSWAMVPNSDGTTTSHKFTGLTNETEYTYEVRAENVAGDGADASVSVTPRVGVAVSFVAASASITEGSSTTVTLTLGEAPATGVTVTVPITATPGAGLGATEYSGVPASVTFAAGETVKNFTVAVADDTLDEPDEELTLELGTLPDGYVPGTNGETVITVVDDDVAEWRLTLTGSNGSAVTELTEGGASATARISITNSVRFETDQTITLEWGGQEITSGLIQGASGSATITITAGQSNGTLAVSAPQRQGDLYRPPETEALTAMLGGAQIGDGIQLAFADDEDPPVLTIRLRDTRVVENGSAFLDGTLSRGYDIPGAASPLHALATGATTRLPILALNAVDGQPAAPLSFEAGQTTSLTMSMTPTGNSTAGDHATIEFTIPSNPDYYTIGTPSTATLLILDDDAAPGAPRNPTARPGDTEATLSWDHPATYDQIWVSDYQYRQRAGTGPWTSWAAVPGSDGETTSHTVTGLTNDTEYTFEMRGRNSNHNGAVAQVMVTPREGIAVSFGAASVSITEGGSATVTLTLAEAPAAGATVTAEITATRGAGLGAAEYAGVPESVTFNAGETSKSFTVTTVNDTDDEPHRVLTLGLGELPEGYVPGTHHEFVLTILDDDHPIVSVTFGDAADSAPEGASVTVTVRLSQAPEREVVVPITATRGANLGADEHEAVPSSVTFAADATEAVFTLRFEDDAAVEGNETLTLAFGTLPFRVNAAGANPQLVLTVTDDDGPPAAPDVSVRTGNAFAVLSWTAVVNDSPVLRYQVRWRETDGGAFNAWQSVGLVNSYQVEGLTNGKAHEFEVRAVNAHGNGEEVSAPGTPTARLTGIPKAVQVLQVKATDSGRAELSWTRPSNATDKVTVDSVSATFSQIQGYRIEVCRTTCDDETNWYALVANTGRFAHSYVHQVLAPGVIRENRYRVRAININGKAGPWSNVATLDETEVEGVYLQTPDDSTLWVRFKVRNPDGNPLYVRYTNTGTGTMGHTEYRLTRKEDVKLVLSGLEAGSWHRVDLDFSPDFDSARKQSHWYGTARAGETPLTSPYARDLVDAQVWQGGAWHDASTTALTIRMGDTGKYRVRLKPCDRTYSVIPRRIESPAGRLRASPVETAPALFTNLDCKVEGTGYRTDEDGNRLTMSDVYDMTNFPDRANDFIPIYGGSENDWYEVTVTARALEDYAADVRADALLSAPFAVVYNHEVWYSAFFDTRSGPVSEGTGLVRILVDRPADAVLPAPGGVTIGSDRVMTWDAVSGATGYLVEWRHGTRYSDRANQDRSLQTATGVRLPSGRGPVTARVRAYSNSGVSEWSAELTWDSRAPTLNVLDTAVNEADGSVGFLVTLDPAATGIVTVQYTTVDATAVAPADYTATSGTVTFAPGETRKQTALVPIVNDGEEDSGETFRLVLSSPTGSDANNGAAVLGDAEAVATILNSEREVASLTGFTLVDAGTNADLMLLANGSTVELGELLASSYGIRAEMGAGAAPGSVRLALTGAKAVTATDDAAPWSLYGDGAGRVNGASLPVGSYTLRATAYADSGGRGDERGSLEVSFTVAAGALGVTTPGPFTVAEGKTAVATLAASDTGTGGEAVWSVPAGAAGGADGAAFTLTSEGVLSLVAAKDFEAPDDADGDGTYEVTVSVTVGAHTATAALSVTLSDVNEPALSVTTAGPFTVAEGETAVAALAASDTGTGATAVWSIPAGAEGGADGAAFMVTSEGVLSLVAAKDFEASDDADGDGTYEVTVAVAAPASSMAGAQSATAALLVTLSDVNEAPVAQASASPARVRQGARVTLDGSASTDPDAGDTLTYLWSQADDGAPRVTLSDASAEQPAFTSPSDLAAETALGFTLRVTDADGLYAEDTLSVAVTLISEVSISAASNYAAEGAEAVFRLTRAGSARAALTVPVTVEETGEMLGTAAPADATFAAGARETELRVPTAADAAQETDSRVTARLASGSGWQLADGAATASVTVLDDDAAPVTETAAADVTIWSADMTVVEYSSRSIGAGSADLFSNQIGRAGLRAKYLWYDPSERVLRLGFDAGLYDAEPLTLHVGDVSLGFPENPGGDASFTLEGVDLSWTDGETLEARISKPSASAVSTDATLASLGVEGATLSPAFDARVLLYWAVADAGAETVSVSAQANDDGATVAYGPAADADAELAEHQVAAPTGGEILVVVTVTAEDGTVRRYRVVVAPTAAESNTAPTGAPTISGTPQVEQTLAANTSSITDEDGLTNVTFEYQWLAGGTDIAGATGSRYLLTSSEQGQTIQVRVTFTDDADNEETLTSVATVPVAAAPNREATGAPTISGTPQVGETLTADTSAIADENGLDDVSYSYQWIASDGNSDTVIEEATGPTYIPSVSDVGKTITVRVTFTDDADNRETLNSEATGAVAATVPTTPQSLTVATGDQEQRLDVSWQAPSSNGGSDVTGYKVQWKESPDSWDTETDVSETTVTGTTHTITSLTGGVEYAVRVIATNVAGDGPASTEARATPADSPTSGEEGTETVESDSTAAWTATLTVGVSGSGSEAVWGYSWFLDGMGTLDERTYSEGDQTIEVMAILMSNGFVAFNVRPHPSVDFVLTVDGTEFASADASEVKSQTLISYVWATTLDWAEDDRVALSLTLKDTDSAEQSEPAENTSATGLPTISGTPQVGQDLTADTSAIADEDGLTNVSYRYQWMTGGSDIDGATGASYELTSSEQGQTITVRVTFTDDRDNAETLTSEATVAVAQAPAPLTVSLENAATSHNGTDVFTFEIRFSEQFGLSYKTLRDHAFTVVGGEVKGAQRMDRDSDTPNIRWLITVGPDGNGDVAVTLPATTDCAADGAICTEDGRMLSNSLELTVSGPGQ